MVHIMNLPNISLYIEFWIASYAALCVTLYIECTEYAALYFTFYAVLYVRKLNRIVCWFTLFFIVWNASEKQKHKQKPSVSDKDHPRDKAQSAN